MQAILLVKRGVMQFGARKYRVTWVPSQWVNQLSKIYGDETDPP
jgi:hypothetical protein